MHTRRYYIDKIKPFIGEPMIKIITGMRRVGKSVLLQQLYQSLFQEEKKNPKNMILIDKESLAFDFIRNYQDLNTYILDKWEGIEGQKYLFIDEVQEIEGWERCINSLFKRGDIDIYITGSNAHLLSSELATLLSGRTVNFPTYALSFEEYLQFKNYPDETLNSSFDNYVRWGGLPGALALKNPEATLYQYVRSIYDTIVIKDIMSRHNIRESRVLESVMRYALANIGNTFSASAVTRYFKSQQIKISVDTVLNYLDYLIDTFALYRVGRFDIQGKPHLKVDEKYYVSDLSLRHALIGFREQDINLFLENIVYLELKRRGYDVYIGRSGKQEIDFVAFKNGTPVYYQVSFKIGLDPQTYKREFEILMSIPDNYPKYVISMDEKWGKEHGGVQRLHINEFLRETY